MTRSNRFQGALGVEAGDKSARFWLFALLLGLAGVVALPACDDTAPACTTGQLASCHCESGDPGTKECLSDGTYGACGCSTDGGPQTLDAGADAGPDAGVAVDGGPDAGPADLDGGPDAGPDGGLDAGPDSGTDGGPDAGSPYGGFACPVDPAHPTAPIRYYPGGPTNPNLGFAKGQIFPDIKLADGYWNLTTGTPVLDTATFYQAANSFHDLYCSNSFKVAMIDVGVAWAHPCAQEGSDLAQYGAPAWLPDGGIVLGILVQGSSPGAAASKTDLDTWITNSSANYPLVISTDADLLSTLASFPTNYVVDMDTMQVLDVSEGYLPCAGTCTDAIYDAMQTALGK